MKNVGDRKITVGDVCISLTVLILVMLHILLDFQVRTLEAQVMELSEKVSDVEFMHTEAK